MHPFNRSKFKFGWAIAVAVVVVALSVPAGFAEVSSPQIKKNKTGLFQDIFNTNLDDLTSYFHLDRFYRLITRGKVRAANVNIYDEVPDSNFFTNRHGRQKMSIEDLVRGPRVDEGPSVSGNITITDGKFQGLHPGFFVTDSRGEKYLLKFDDIDLFELETSAEVITSLFYHAIGYNVPQYTIAIIPAEMLIPGPHAQSVDDTGFKKQLTKERLEEYLLFLPQDANGHYRASASKLLEGENKGHFDFQGRRKNDPDDRFDHKTMREIRALQVFGSWLNNYDTRESNTLDMLVTDENGKKVLKHYLIDFNSALGRGSLFPMFSKEHMVDYGEATKAFFGIGFWEKPWQKRWREAGQEVKNSPAVWDFDNHYFDPGKYKLQLAHYAMKDLTRADGFWAAKIIMGFSDEEIKAIVNEGKLSDPEDAAYVTRVLIERRDIIGKYWFNKANSLDDFDLSGSSLTFKDLAVEHGFQDAAGTTYHVRMFGEQGGKFKKVGKTQTKEPSVNLSAGDGFDELRIWIKASRAGSKKLSPYVLVTVTPQGITGIKHQD